MGGDGRSGLLDSVPEGDIGGQLVHIGLHSEHIGSVVLEGALEGGECRCRSPQSLLSDEHLYSNLLRLAVHDNLLVVLVLYLHVDLLSLCSQMNTFTAICLDLLVKISQSCLYANANVYYV